MRLSGSMCVQMHPWCSLYLCASVLLCGRCGCIQIGLLKNQSLEPTSVAKGRLKLFKFKKRKNKDEEKRKKGRKKSCVAISIRKTKGTNVIIAHIQL